MSKYQIGVIGLGVMGRRMIQAIEADERFSVVACYDPHLPIIDGLAPSSAAVIENPEVDCVYVASPPAAHAATVAEVCSAGKAVFCEKPLAATPDEAAACVQMVKDANVPSGVNFPLATAPGAVRLRDIVASGELGRIQSAKLTLRFAAWPRGWQAGAGGWIARPQEGGFMREVGSHFLFLAGRLFGRGELASVSVERGEAGTETRIAAMISYDGLALEIDAAIEGDDEDYNRLEVVGELGVAALTDWYRLDYRGELSPQTPSMPTQLDGLAQLLERDPRQPLATFEEAADVVALIEQILSS